MKEPCPCHGCTERFSACSDRCPKDARGEYGYKAWKARCIAQQQHLEANKNRWFVPWTESRGKRINKNSKFGADCFKRGGDQ